MRRACLTLLVALTPLLASGLARADDGAALYRQHCAVCHQADGAGVPDAFPPLAGNPHLDDSAHVRSVIEQGLTGPLTVGTRSFDGAMPAFAGRLPASAIAALSDFVVATWGGATPGAGKASAAAAGATPSAAPPGDPAVGAELFSGLRRLANGAPPCGACHSVDGANPLGGGSMGRDLTTAYDRFGHTAGLQAALTNVGFPVMRPIFARAPLTPGEIADLTAYLRDTAAARAPGAAARDPGRYGFNWLWLFAALGAAALSVLLLVGWPRQRTGVAEHLRRTGRLRRNRR